jgi:hypothetical protein
VADLAGALQLAQDLRLAGADMVGVERRAMPGTVRAMSSRTSA